MLISQNLILIFILGLGLLVAFFIYRQQQALAGQIKDLKRQRFFQKKETIVQELLNIGLPSPAQLEELKLGNANKNSNQEKPANKTSNKQKTAKAKAEKQKPADKTSKKTQKKKSKLPKDPFLLLDIEEQPDQLAPAPQPREPRMAPFSDYASHQDRFTDRVKKYAHWIADHTERFYIENTLANPKQEDQHRYIRVLFDEDHLKRLNGHWFNLFRSMDHTEAYELLNTPDAQLLLHFDLAGLEAIKAEGLALIKEAVDDKNKRLNQLLVDTGIDDFIEYIDMLIRIAK